MQSEDNQMPLEIYSSLVSSLFGEVRSMLIGSAGASLAAAIIAVKSGQPSHYVVLMAILIIAGFRTRDIRRFRLAHKNVLSLEELQAWENRYLLGAALYVGLLGTFCMLTFLFMDDAAAQLTSFAVAICYLIGVAGRNFANTRHVVLQIVCAGVPITIGLLTMGASYLPLVILVLLPFFLSVKFIAGQLRKTLVDAVINARNVSRLAERLDAALNNMPDGLAMFDAHERLLVANSQLATVLKLPLEKGMEGLHLTEVLGLIASMGLADHRDLNLIEHKLASGIYGSNEIPLELLDGRTIAFRRKEVGSGGFVLTAEDVTERRGWERRLRQLAQFDSLTGLPNRSYFQETLKTALSTSWCETSPCALLFIDLDNFKQVNDTLGHRHGDDVLCQVSKRLVGLIGNKGVVARFGGDEFVALLHHAGHKEAQDLSQSLVTSIAQPYEIEAQKVVLGVSIGIAIAETADFEPEQLLRDADTALYRAKAEGRNTWRFFKQEMAVQAQARRVLELDVRAATEQQSFELYYQPLFNLMDHRISSYEALLRWQHPERGFIPPSEFIPVAEEIGLIVEIGDWVLQTACRECRNWPAHVGVAVNLSSVQFKVGDVVASVRQALKDSGLAPNRLELEITESVALQDEDRVRAALQRLQALGVRISFDDFGTGYSSLSYLRNFRLDKIKIDRSFLLDLDTRPESIILLRGISRLSSELGMTVAVEGVETQEQLSLLASVGHIDEVQGYFIGRPVPPGKLEGLIAPIGQRVAAGR